MCLNYWVIQPYIQYFSAGNWNFVVKYTLIPRCIVDSKQYKNGFKLENLNNDKKLHHILNIRASTHYRRSLLTEKHKLLCVRLHLEYIHLQDCLFQVYDSGIVQSALITLSKLVSSVRKYSQRLQTMYK